MLHTHCFLDKFNTTTMKTNKVIAFHISSSLIYLTGYLSLFQVHTQQLLCFTYYFQNQTNSKKERKWGYISQKVQETIKGILDTLSKRQCAQPTPYLYCPHYKNSLTTEVYIYCWSLSMQPCLVCQSYIDP